MVELLPCQVPFSVLHCPALPSPQAPPPHRESFASLSLLRRRVGWQPPAVLQTVATLATLQVLAHYTFWGSAIRWGITQSAFDSLTDMAAAVRAALAK